MVEQAEQTLNEEQKSQLYALLLEYHTLFATGDQDIGHTSKVQHKIDTGDSEPIRQSVRRSYASQLRRHEARELLDNMLSQGVIRTAVQQSLGITCDVCACAKNMAHSGFASTTEGLMR